MHVPPFWQVTCWQKSRSFSQRSPLNPVTQIQLVRIPTPSTQVPSLRQESDWQKGRSFSQVFPSKPSVQLQDVNVPGPSTQVPPLRQIFSWQKSRSTSQKVPFHPGSHRHSKSFTKSIQRPFWHMTISHSLMSVLHTASVYPGKHMHVNEDIDPILLMFSEQIPW